MDFHLGAFVDVAVKRLVRFVGAVGHFVADQVAVDALAVVAAELGGVGARCILFFYEKKCKAIFQSIKFWFIKLTAINFIGVVPAVILAIAPVLVPDTFEVLARELVGTARLVLRVAFFAFIGAISAVVVVVTKPALIDTSSVAASELFLAARLRRGAMVQSGIFVRSVDTIGISVAQPLLGDALGPAPSLIRFASEFVFVVALSVI